VGDARAAKRGGARDRRLLHAPLRRPGARRRVAGLLAHGAGPPRAARDLGQVRRGLSAPLTAAVAVAFADSSIVVLALPELYGRFDTTIEAVSWVVTAYNLAVAATALALVFLVHRVSTRTLLGVGLGVFLAASIACAVTGSLGF